MESGDGLIVRLRISGGIVAVTLAHDIAGWSRRWGNGQIDLSNRANLQLRGISEHDLPALRDALAEWNLLDTSEAGEAVRNVISSPLTGLDPGAALDIRMIARDLERHLESDSTLHGLPGKFGFAIDDGGLFGLDDVPADIRFVAWRTRGGPAFDIRLDGAASHRIGRCCPNELVPIAIDLSKTFLRLRTGQEPRIRRMRDLVAAQGVEVIAREAGLNETPAPVSGRLVRPSTTIGPHALGSSALVGVGLPFGRVVAEDLDDLASLAAANGARELRLTPWRAFLVPVLSIQIARDLSASLRADRFIVNPGDPRCRIAACPGAPSCTRGTTLVHGDAATVMTVLVGAEKSGIVLHVSGCEKGCAHPGPAPITLVARNGRYDLVRNGRPSESPTLRGLTIHQATEQVRQIVTDQSKGATA
jgi:precorrin-3B synthase